MYAFIISRTLERAADQKREKAHTNKEVKSRAKSSAKSRDPVKRDAEFLFPCKITRNFFSRLILSDALSGSIFVYVTPKYQIPS